MEWDPPSADGVKVLDIVPTYVGTHRLTGDVHTGGMRAQPLSYTLTSYNIYMFLLFREIKTTALSSSVKAKVKIIWLLDGGF